MDSSIINLGNTSTAEFTLYICICVILYFILSGCIVRRRPRLLWIPAFIVLFSGSCFYWGVYGDAGALNPLSRLVLSVTSALEMFLFKLNTTYGRFTDFFYLVKKDGSFLANGAVENRLLLGVGIYLCAVWTTAIFFVHFFAGRLVSKAALVWRRIRKPSAGIHLFIGVCPESISVAKSIGKGKDVVFVDVPDDETMPERVSLQQLFKGLRTNTDISDRVSEEIPGALVLKARKPLSRCKGGNFFRELGLGRLMHWAVLPQTSIYLLSDKQGENLSVFPRLQSCRAQIYVHAKRENIALFTEMASGGNIHFVDTSFLAMQALKLREDLYPVHFVEVAKDKLGRPAGYVKGAFNSLICGFGEAGRGALSFLYEFGAFPGRNKKQSPFLCTVIDRNMPVLAGDYMMSHPGVDPEKVKLVGEEFGSDTFWEWMERSLDTLNYVFVSLGDDELNMQSALSIMQYSFQHRKEPGNFLILVKLDNPGAYAKLIAYYNVNLGRGAILRTIGDISETWTLRNISGEGITEYARRFYSCYALASGDPLSWEERMEKINSQPGASDFACKMEIQRKTGQDFANFFHSRVKAALMPASFWKDESVSASIPYRENGKVHCTHKDAEVAEVLDYMAVGEHLRWRTSHEANGYRLGPAKREDIMTHTDICPYEKLSERVKHYDWVVVKTTLEMLRKSEE